MIVVKEAKVMWINKLNKQIERKKTEKQFTKKENALRNAVISIIANCGQGLKVFGSVDVYSGERITIGENCKLNSQVILNGRSGITIGDDVTISSGAKVLSTGYDLDVFFNFGERIHKEDMPIFIGNQCWIGAGAIILPGVQITGEYVVIGAGSVVTKIFRRVELSLQVILQE